MLVCFEYIKRVILGQYSWCFFYAVCWSMFIHTPADSFFFCFKYIKSDSLILGQNIQRVFVHFLSMLSVGVCLYILEQTAFFLLQIYKK